MNLISSAVRRHRKRIAIDRFRRWFSVSVQFWRYIRVVLISVFPAGFCHAQSMFRGDVTHSGAYAGPAPRQFHRIRWKFPTGDRIVSSPVWREKVLYFGGDDGNVYAVDAE